MKIFLARFTGVEREVIHVPTKVSRYLSAESAEEAIQKLKETWRKIDDLTVTEAPVVKAEDVPKDSYVYRVEKVDGGYRMMEDLNYSSYQRTKNKDFIKLLGEPCFINLCTGMAENLAGKEFVIRDPNW